MSSASRFFPPPEQADEDGFLAWSETVSSDALFDAYTHGIFPWPSDQKHILWFSLPERCVLSLETLHLPHGIKRDLKNVSFSFTVNQSFSEVIRHCARAKRHGQSGTWITPALIRAYEEFHQRGFAWSFEARDAHGMLAGGLYGVHIGTFFAGESMFFLQPGASKFALVHALRFLKEQRQVSWIDTQVPSRLFELLGCRLIPRAEYLRNLQETLST